MTRRYLQEGSALQELSRKLTQRLETLLFFQSFSRWFYLSLKITHLGTASIKYFNSLDNFNSRDMFVSSAKRTKFEFETA